MGPWKHSRPSEEIKIGWRRLTRKTFQRPDGVSAEYVTMGSVGERHGAVLALTPENKVIIARQFRPGPEKIFDELPGGGIGTGEEPQVAVMRELREETGYASDDVLELGRINKSAYSNATCYYYFARNCRQVHPQELEDGEFVEVALLSIDELIANAKHGRMSDGIAVLLAYEKLNEIQEEAK